MVRRASPPGSPPEKLPHKNLTALYSQIHYVDVGSEPDVIGEVPADMIGIVIDDDVVRIPEPVVTEINVEWSYGEVETAEPEAAGTTAFKTPHMSATDTAGEPAMLPRTIQMLMRVVAAGIMAYPFSIGMYVGSVGMSRPVVEVGVSLGRVRSGYSRRAVCRNVLTAATDLRPATAATMAAVLCQRSEREQETYRERSNQLFHFCHHPPGAITLYRFNCFYGFFRIPHKSRDAACRVSGGGGKPRLYRRKRWSIRSAGLRSGRGGRRGWPGPYR